MKQIIITTSNGSWEVVPANKLAGLMLTIIIAYLFLRAILWMVAMHEAYRGAPTKWVFFGKRSGWTVDRRRLQKPTGHAILGLVFFASYLIMGDYFGWIHFIEIE